MAIVAVVGSTNIDLVVRTPRFPKAGETVKGSDFRIFHGGKGANQTVAASRLGVQVNFITKIGSDDFGKNALKNFQKEGIKSDYIIIDETFPTGVAFIEVDDEGQNRIIISPGANNNLKIDDITPIQHAIEEAGVVLVQLEIPLETVGYVMELAVRAGALVILNPAPAEQIPVQFFKDISIITPNESEAALLTQLDSDQQNAIYDFFRARGVQNLIITRGEKGACFITDTERGDVPGFHVRPIDTTAAGDAFNAGLAVAMSEDYSIRDAVRFANAVGALSVTTMGAQTSMPRREDVEKFLKNI